MPKTKKLGKVELGAVVTTPGSTIQNKTGSWRALKPIRDENKCIKVIVAGDHKETAREQAYYRLLEKRNISWRMLPRFYGQVDTNRGRGAVFELIRDYNAAVSKTLKHYLSANNEIALNYRDLSRALIDLKQ